MRHTLEDRVARLERIMHIKNEIALLEPDKATAKDEKDFVNQLFFKYASIRKRFKPVYSSDPRGPFELMLKSKGMVVKFTSTDQGTTCTVSVNDRVVDSIEDCDVYNDLDKVAEIILQAEQKSERFIRNEAISLNDFESKEVTKSANQILSKYKYSAIAVGDNSDYGFLNIRIEDEKHSHVADYFVEAEDTNKFVVSKDNKQLAVARSLQESGKLIAKDVEKSYIKS